MNRHWYKHPGNGTNIFQIVATNYEENHHNSLGVTRHIMNITYVTTSSHTSQASMKDTVVHELGHQFDVDHGPNHTHVDSSTLHHPNHENSDDCIMTYLSNDTDGKSEFCIDNCIKVVREQSDPKSNSGVSNSGVSSSI